MDKQYVKGESYFVRENKTDVQYKYLNEDLKCEVLIIGGGVTAAITGYYFSKKGMDTVIIDKGRIAHGSTSITTSLLQYELDDNAKKLVNILGEKNTIKAYKLGEFALDEVEKIITECGNNCEYKKVDCLLYSSKKSEIGQIEDEYNFRKENGFDVCLINEENNPFDFDIKAGVLAKNGGAVLDPFLFTQQLLEKSNLRIYENTKAVNIVYEKDFVTVETEYGHKIKCKKLIAATGYNTSLFTKQKFATKYTTFNLITKPLENIDKIFDNTVFRDNNDPYHYFRTTHDKRIIIGGEDIRFDPDFDNKELVSKSYENLRHMLYSVCGEKIETEYECCGAFATTKDNLGFIGPDPKHKNLWYCLGYGANGILFAVLGGYFLSKLYNGEEDENMNLFKIDRF